MQKKINILKQKNEDLLEINEKISKEKCIVNIEEKSLEDYKKILHEKNNEIKELKKENMNLLTDVDLKDRKLEELLENKENNKNENINNIKNFSKKYFMEQIQNLNNNLKLKDLEIHSLKNNENNIKKNIDESYELIKEIYKNIQIKYNDILENNLNDDNKIILKSFKEIIDQINTDNNGNISLNEKLKTINEFNNIIKTHIELLFKNMNLIKNNNNDNNDNIKDINNKQDNNKLNNINLFNSQNGQNNAINNNNPNNINNINSDNNNQINSRINNFNKKLINNDMFKKIDITLNNFNAHNSESKLSMRSLISFKRCSFL
jgi:hypothetical protein